MVSTFFKGVGRALSTLFWCSDPEEEELQNTDQQSLQVLSAFAEEFEQQQLTILGSNQANRKIEGWKESFQNLCLKSRRSKKPILAFVLENATNATFGTALRPVLNSSAACDVIKSDFLVTGFTVAEPPMPQFESLINLKASGQQTKACVYFCVVSHEMQVKLLKRIDLNGDATTPD